MKQKKIAVLLAMALTFSQSTGVVMPVTAEELTEDAGLVESQSENNEETEMAETTEADMTEGEENSGNETAELPDEAEDIQEEDLTGKEAGEVVEAEEPEEDDTVSEIFSDEEGESFSDGSGASEAAGTIAEEYQFHYDYVDRAQSDPMLPNSQITINTWMMHKTANGSWQDDPSAEYKMEILPPYDSDLNYVGKADISLDGNNIVIKSHNITGPISFKVKVTKDGTDLGMYDLSANISEYMILPENLRDAGGDELNPEVGEQIDIEKDLKPQLVRYKDGKGDPIPVTGNNYKIVIESWTISNMDEIVWDYDTSAWKWIDVPGQELPILERTAENDSWFTLAAKEKNADGNWITIASRRYRVGSLQTDDKAHNDNSEEKSTYNLQCGFEGTTGNGAMLPNSQMTVITRLVNKMNYEEIGDYRLEILSQSKKGDVSVSQDGKNLLIKSGKRTGMGCCYVSVQLPDGNGGYQEAFRRDIGFEVSEYVILPEDITDASGNVINPEIGQQIDIVKDMKPQLVRYKNGKGDPIPVTGNNYKIVISSNTDQSTGETRWDYDNVNWKWISVPGQELPILERASAYGTWFSLTAMEKDADGKWSQIASRQYNLDILPEYKDDNIYEKDHNDNSEEQSSYALGTSLENGTGDSSMLPNSQMTIKTDLVDKTKNYQSVKNYKLKIIETSKLGEISVSQDGKNLLIKSGDFSGGGCCYVSVQIPNGKGGYKEAFRKDIWFTVSEYVLLPKTLKDKSGKTINPAVGKSVDLSNLGIKIVQYKKGKGNPINVTSSNMKVTINSWKDESTGKTEYDYDSNTWTLKKVAGKDLPILTRKKVDSTWVALTLMKKTGDGNWNQVIRKTYNIDIAEHTHAWTTETIIKKATCTVKGSQIKRCTICGEEKKVSISAKGHTKIKDAAVAATVFNTGKTEGSHCKVCGTVIQKQKSTAKLKPAISLTASSLKLKKGQSTSAFKATGFAKGDYVTKVTSKNSAIVKVSSVKSNGTFKLTAGKKTGTTTVTVTLKSKTTKSFKVTVKNTLVKTTKLSGVPKNKTISKGKTFTIKAVAAPKNTDENIIYRSSSTKVATVTSKGVVKGVNKGTATITVQSGSKKMSCKVTVK